MKEVRNETPDAGESSATSDGSPHPAPPDFHPGQVWWCDGIALAFDPYFKRRPVLIVSLEDDTAHVIPLSSHRRYGQEAAVTHNKGVSYMTGSVRAVLVSALQKPLGVWADFPAWWESQQTASESKASLWTSLIGFLQKLQKGLRRWLLRIDMVV